jgi:elongation factor P--(R)-beta-lysine ligase
LDASIEDDKFLLARKAQALQIRAGLIQSIRLFFTNRGFLEVETPVRIPAPAPEENIEALPSGNWFLQTSPELAMKRLLAAGYHQIFQICKCFRAHERGRMHLPEFTMLEWYVSGFDYYRIMDQCEEMIITAVMDAGFPVIISWQNSTINLDAPWERIPVKEAFRRYAPLTPAEALQKDRFDEIMVEYIEPNLGFEKPVFLFDYPAELAALAKLKKGNPLVAERFELYIAGVELANGFTELTDTREQRQRFEKAQKLRAAKSYAPYPLPEKFLSSLDDLPACAGIALGIDRLAMLFTGAASIDDVVPFPPEIL